MNRDNKLMEKMIRFNLSNEIIEEFFDLSITEIELIRHQME